MSKDEVIVKENFTENVIEIDLKDTTSIDSDLEIKDLTNITDVIDNDTQLILNDSLVTDGLKLDDINYNRLDQIKRFNRFNTDISINKRKIINNKYINTTNNSLYSKNWKRQINYLKNNNIAEDILLITNNEIFYENIIKVNKNIKLLTTNKDIKSEFEIYHYDNLENIFESINLSNDSYQIIYDMTDKEYFSENYFKGNIYESFDRISDLLKKLSTYKNLFKINVVINDLYKITGSEKFNPHKSLIIGPLKVASQEFNNIKCKIIDIDNYSSALNILHSLDNNEFESSYRNNYKWEKYFEKIDINNLNVDISKNILKENGVYLISGGLGNIGLNIAEFLSKNYKANLILINRFTDPMDNVHLSDKILEFEENGSEILLKKANVINYSTLEKAFIEGIEKFGKIDGVINASDIKDKSKPIIDRNSEDNIILETKVQSSKNLAALAEKFSCDFLFIFSTIESIIGYKENSESTSANIFQDSLSDFYKGSDLKVFSTNWLYWNTSKNKNIKSRSVKNNKTINKKYALKLFELIINSDYNSLIISPMELHKI